MASDPKRQQAERLFVDDGIGPTEIAERVKVSRKTVYNWRDAGGWEHLRTQRLHELTQAREAGERAGLQQAAAEVREQVEGGTRTAALTLADAQAILADIARDTEATGRDRVAALKLAGEWNGWSDAAKQQRNSGGLADALALVRERRAPRAGG